MTRALSADRISAHLHSTTRFVLGLLLTVAFLFSRGPLVRIVEALVFFWLATLSGRRVRPLYFVLLTGWVVFFQLLLPWGRVLATLGPFTVTEGALWNGIEKGVTLSGLVFVSVFGVSRELALPGRFGGLVAGMFYHYERLYALRPRLRRGSFFEDLDGLLTILYPIDGPDRPDEPPNTDTAPRPRTQSTTGGLAASAVLFCLIAGLSAASWVPGLFPRLG